MHDLLEGVGAFALIIGAFALYLQWSQYRDESKAIGRELDDLAARRRRATTQEEKERLTAEWSEVLRRPRKHKNPFGI